MTALARHALARVNPIFGSVRTGRFTPGIQQGYIISCSCGWKDEAGTKPKALAQFEAHKAAEKVDSRQSRG